MSFALEFAPDASSQWRELELTLQELTLDELDRTAAAGPHSRGVFVRDFTHPLGGLLHYVFLALFGIRLVTLCWSLVSPTTPAPSVDRHRGIWPLGRFLPDAASNCPLTTPACGLSCARSRPLPVRPPARREWIGPSRADAGTHRSARPALAPD